MAETRRPSEDEVRDAVRRIVDRVVPAAASPAVAPAPTASPAASPADAPGRLSIAIGADHGGFALKEQLRRALAEQGHDVHDCGTHGDAAVDYPDFAHAVARLVADGTCVAGIVVDGAGIGSAMAANKVPGIRAALCYDLSTARNSREHNHANVLTLGARLLGPGLALDIVNEWLATPWGPGRHAARVARITEIERHYLETGPVDGSR
jgi:ribose 5-phosphate isomerase B